MKQIFNNHPKLILLLILSLNGKSFRRMGAEPAEIPVLPQTGLEVLPTRTIYTFAGSGVSLTLISSWQLNPDGN
ncbi:MAG: hypothetical protein ABSF51_12995 [Verrucomicrobiota bacterium]